MSFESDSDEVKVVQPRLYTSKGIRKKKNSTESHTAKITARARASQTKNKANFYADGNLLFEIFQLFSA